MAENYDFEDFEEDNNEYVGNDLAKKLRKQIDNLQKQIKEKDNLLEEYQSYSHEASVGEILESFGLNPRIAQFIPSDVGADSDSVSEWLTEYGDAFGIEAVVEDSYTESPDAQAYEQMSAVDDGGSDPFVGNDLASRVNNAKSPEELMNILRG